MLYTYIYISYYLNNIYIYYNVYRIYNAICILGFIHIYIILGMFASQSLFLDCILHGPGLARVKALCARPTSHYMGSIQHVGYQLRFSLLFNGHTLDAK